MFELRPFERRNNHVAAYDPWDQMERAFFGDGSWGRGLSEFKTDIQDKGDSYLLEADLPGFKKEDIHVDVDGDTMTIRAERHSEHEDQDKKGNYVRGREYLRAVQRRRAQAEHAEEERRGEREADRDSVKNFKKGGESRLF